jgi:dTMP kinase
MATGSPLTFYDEALPGVDVAGLTGKLIVVEGPDGVGRSTQIALLRTWLEHSGHAVMHTGMARSALAGKGIKQAKEGNTLGPLTMNLFYATDFADRLENEILPALRAGFVVLTDRYIFSSMARASARGADPAWIRQVFGFALRPHAIYYLRGDVQDLLPRVVYGRGGFDYWESGMDVRLGKDLYESFTRYQHRVIRSLDSMAQRYGFEVIDASRTPEQVFQDLKKRIAKLLRMPKRAKGAGRPGPVRPRRRPARQEVASTRAAPEAGRSRLVAAGG